MSPTTDDDVWKALADGRRRQILDVLAQRPHTTGEIVDRVDGLCRTAVMRHVETLAAAGLVRVRREGRTRWNEIDVAPIRRVCGRWVEAQVQRTNNRVERLRGLVENKSASQRRGTIS